MVEICLGTISIKKNMEYCRMIHIRVIEVGTPNIITYICAISCLIVMES